MEGAIPKRIRKRCRPAALRPTCTSASPSCNAWHDASRAYKAVLRRSPQPRARKSRSVNVKAELGVVKAELDLLTAKMEESNLRPTSWV